ncbi:MAG: universal stress protein [Acidimicrobiales bacterium]|jgi:nucleotide-binding universal stress UspA family protein
MSAAPESQRIVVGVDGSPESATALSFAIDEARLRGADLHVIYAYAAQASLTGWTADDYYKQVEAEAKAALEAVANAAPPTDDLTVDWRCIPGNPAEILIEESRHADILVVGSRGLGGFLGLVMGSVSSQCVHHSRCPVLVVREEH